MRVAGRIWVVTSALALAACSAGKAEEAAKPAQDAPIPVTLSTVGAPGEQVTRITGTVRYEEEVALAFSSPGRVQAIAVDVGDAVRPGQLLATLEPAPADANAVAAQQDAKRTRAELARVRTLAGQGWVTRARLEAAEAEAAAAAARVEGARFEQRYARIVAPGAGVVLARTLEPGAIAAAGTPVLTVGEARGGLVLQLPLTDTQAARLRLGASARVRFAALGDVTLTGTVSEIGGRGDPRTGTFLAEIRLPMAPGLRSGLIGTAEFTGLTAEAGPLAVPATALFAARTEEGFVYVYEPGSARVRARMVRLGEVTDQGVTILSGLRPGEKIVRTGLDRLRDGARVRLAG